MKKKNEVTEEYLADIITQKPYAFYAGRKLFRLYPVTLAKKLVMRPYIDDLAIDMEKLRCMPDIEVIRVVREHKNTCCELLAIHSTPNTYKDLFNIQSRAERRNILMSMQDADLAAHLMNVLMLDKTAAVMEYLGLDKEHERMKKVFEVKRKHNKNSIDFGGLSLFGSFIGRLKEMGYTENEILFELGYSYLQLVLADKVTSVYLSDDELEELPNLAVSNGDMDANNPEMTDKILGMMNNRLKK